MTTEIDFLELSNYLKNRYSNYIHTTHMISENHCELKSAFEKALKGEQTRIYKEPYLSSIPIYKKGASIQDMIARGILCDAFQDSPFYPELYKHQERALELIFKQENIVVSSGTGSGKTESFIIPIFDYILRHPDKKGIKAILIYPMNALANDQLERLRNLTSKPPFSVITFGRYTGETEESTRTSEMPVNECGTREEIKNNPPDILLTNFAMLEYLLIRPDDSVKLFDSSANLKFIVLDEAHSYTGAQGVEISFLMRRLKDRVSSKLQFILTSATLGEISKTADFANSITGERFREELIITGTTTTSFVQEEYLSDIPTLKTIEKIGGDENITKTWNEILQDTPTLLNKLLLYDIINKPQEKAYTGKDSHFILFDIFKKSKYLNLLQKKLSKTPSSIDDLCMAIGLQANSIGRRGVQWLITVGTYAKEKETSMPLMPIRLHYFIRGLAGASVCLNEACAKNKEFDIGETFNDSARLFLEDIEVCPICGQSAFQLHSCYACGLPVLYGYRSNDGSLSARKKEAGNQTTVAILLPTDRDNFDDDSIDVKDGFLCLNCKKLIVPIEENAHCTCGKEKLLQVRFTTAESEDKMKCPRCMNCNRKGDKSPNVFRSFLSSADASTAVLSEAILKKLPPDTECNDKPLGGRQLIAFSDSRQKAAYFAPYLYKTTRDTYYYKPLIECIAENIKDVYCDTKHVPLSKIQESYRKTISKYVKDPNLYQELARETYEEIRLNICYPSRRKVSLFGTALLGIDFDVRPSEQEIENIFGVISTENFYKYIGVIKSCADIILKRRALNKYADIVAEPYMETAFHMDAESMHKRKQGIANSLWIVSQARQNNRQWQFISKVLKSKDASLIEGVLQGIWDMLIKKGILIDYDAGYQINEEKISITTAPNFYMCDKCGYVTNFQNIGVCLETHCHGSLLEVSDSEVKEIFKNSHYRERYMEPPFHIIAKEHTAQLSNVKGKEYQDKFKGKDINLLSCSTTFEMGIDLGSLKAVIMRNIPPKTHNYIQRTGRAGRRNDGVSIALTYANNMPHDQYIFRDPLNMISGNVSTPIINVNNEVLFQRHVNSMILGYFLKQKEIKMPKSMQVKDFFFNEEKNFTKFINYVENSQELIKHLENIRPKTIDINNNILKSSISTISEIATKLSDKINNIEDQCEDIKQKIIIATNKGDNSEGVKLGAASLRLQAQKKEIENESLIDCLSSFSWLPNYAFPQAAVSLRIVSRKNAKANAQYDSAYKLQRDRSIAISEYAPGTEVIVDGKVYKPKGLLFDSKIPTPNSYVKCSNCNKVLIFNKEDHIPSFCDCGSGINKNTIHYFYKPDGFTTSYLDDPVAPSMFRKSFPYSSETSIIEACESTPNEIPNIPKLKYGIKNKGKLFVVNEGYKREGFRICPTCNTLVAGKEHNDILGLPCQGTPKIMHLANEITTEIVQISFSAFPIQISGIKEEHVFWTSFTTALHKATCDYLEIEERDLGVSKWKEAEVIFYDKIPGGAGYSKRIVKDFYKILRHAQKRVQDCTCIDKNSSCYACLRDYNNQFKWDELKRKPIIDFLEKLFNEISY